MTRILLASTALVAFAGVAAADGHTGISFSGTANLGYNDTNENLTAGTDDNDGFYSDLDITASLSAELDNGLTAAASINLDDINSSGSDFGESYELSLTSETAGLFFGDTGMAADKHWVAAGDMEQDGFSATDGEGVLRGDVSFGGIDASISYIYADTNNDAVGSYSNDDLTQLSIGAAGTFGNFTVALGYQEEIPAAIVGAGTWGGDDLNVNEIFGLSLGTSFGGADVTLAYAEQNSEDSLGIQVAYPVGPVTATVYYVDESNGDANYGLTLAYENGPVAVTLDYDNDQGADIIGVEGSYDVGNGLTVYAGFIDDNGDAAHYVAGTYDLGSGAELLVSYADDEDLGNDEVGAGDYQQGTTIEVSFDF